MKKKTATFDPGDGLPPYRLNVGLVLLNSTGLIFSGKRADQAGADAGWQLPQGGIDKDETPQAAVLRELAEEVGPKVKGEVIAAYPEPLSYDFKDFSGAPRAFDGKYRGQMQYWFYLQMLSPDADIDITQAHDGDPPEFSTYAWRTADEILAAIVAVKRPIYAVILDYLNRHVAKL
ncbi:MAG: RNA pyrophosphohydrolase [Alphaproteobacteria bacterium]